jgi:lipoate-protein ligase A
VKTNDTIIVLDNGGITDPPFNLALEEFLVRQEECEETILLTYINDPSIVLGKHQNVLEETDFRSAEERGVQIVRRISGGGAVYHDHGNLNIALFSSYDPVDHNNYADLLDPIVNLLARLGVTARVNDRNSLVLDDGGKISGSAQFVSRRRMMSHATLLFDADLDRLDSLLASVTPVSDSRAVPSFRSRVANLAPIMPQVPDVASLTEALVEEFAGSRAIRRPLSEAEKTGVADLVRTRYSTWEWRIGRSPKFSLCLQSATGESHVVTFREGIIVAVDGAESAHAESDRELFNSRLDELLAGNRWSVVNPEDYRNGQEGV